MTVAERSPQVVVAFMGLVFGIAIVNAIGLPGAAISLSFALIMVILLAVIFAFRLWPREKLFWIGVLAAIIGLLLAILIPQLRGGDQIAALVIAAVTAEVI